MSHHEDYEQLARAAEAGQLPATPDTVTRGPAAAEAARTALLEATGTTSIDDATRIAIGRPSLDRQGQGRSPVVRARVPQALKDQVQQLAEAQHRKESDILRDALETYLHTH